MSTPLKPKPIVGVSSEEDSIPEEMLTQYGIEIDLYSDFLKAVRVIALQTTDNVSFADALATVGVPKNAKYTPKWQRLFKAAGELIHKQLSQQVKTVVTSTVQNKWPQIINRMANIALLGSDRDATEAAKFLQIYYVGPAMIQGPNDEEDAQDFLKRSRSINPLDIIHRGSVLESNTMIREENTSTAVESTRLQSDGSESLPTPT